jgi:hypothetical protein
VVDRSGGARVVPRERKGRRALTALAALLALVLAVFLWPKKDAEIPIPSSPVAPSASGGEPSSISPAPIVSDRARSPALSPPVPDPAPVIDEIKWEKPEVCSGEENLITVRAHTVNGTDAFLHYLVDGQMGSSVPLRLWLGEDGEVKGQHFVRVFGRTNTPVTVPLPSYKVLDCQPRRMVAIEQRLRSNSWSDFDFVARVITLPATGARTHAVGSAEPLVPASYVWSFGDGEGATTPTALTSHDYEGRRQDSLYSYFTVRVEIRGKTGEPLIGRTSLSLMNSAFESFAQKGVVALLISLDPRFPELDSDGRVTQHVRLWHNRPDPVTLERATVVRFFETGAGQTKPEPIDVTSLLGTSTIPPGKEGITTTVILDTVADPGVFSATYHLAGKSQDGHPAMGSFSVMRPPARPTAENSRPIADPALKAKIVAARQILGKDVVTDEDIWQLEREGMLANLAPAGAPSSAGIAAATSSATLALPPQINTAVPTRGPPVPTSVTPPPTATTAPGGAEKK